MTQTMNRHSRSAGRRFSSAAPRTAFLLVLFVGAGCANSAPGPYTTISNLRVAHAVEPLAVEDAQPVFSWQMDSNVVGQHQSAYQVVVSDERDGRVVWDSNRVASGLAHNIRYAGSSLEADTAYRWSLTVWDASGQAHQAQSRFETGLMSPDVDAWDGAEWIGTNALRLDAVSHVLFEISTDLQIVEGSAASIVLGAGDFRFRDTFLNLENLEGENYIRFELDTSGVGSAAGATLNIYRVGYGPEDSPVRPYRTVSTAQFPETNINDLITPANQADVHHLGIQVETGNITVTLDGEMLRTTVRGAGRGGRRGGGGGRGGGGTRFTISNYSTGNNYNTYPNLSSVGFAAEPGDEVVYTNYTIRNLGQSDPEHAVVFDASTPANYAIFEDLPGVTIEQGGTAIRVANPTGATRVGYADPSHGGLTMLRTEFATDTGKRVSNAKLYVTSLGSNEVYINGERVGDAWFAPGDTQFRETLAYYAHDVTGLVRNGDNSMGAILNPGWYTGYMTFSPGNFNFFGDTEALLARLVLTYDDGTRDVMVSHTDSWRVYQNGPIESGSFFQGERYNANKEANVSVGDDHLGWSTVAYDDSAWRPAEVIEPRDWIAFELMARYDKPVTVVEELTAQRVVPVHSEDGRTYTYDMGVNLVGVPSITIPAGWLHAGDQVILRYGEQLYPGRPGDDPRYVDLYGDTGSRRVAGRILTETYRAALSTDFYTAKNSDAVVITPTSTYRGYQYIQITIPGHEGPLSLENVRGLVLSSDTLPSGTYTAETVDGTTGDLVNQLFRNIQRSQLGNFFTIPTDCPQRNERMGWTGDAQAYSRTATYNSDVYRFFRQWMVALRDDQSTEGGIGSTVPTYSRTDATGFADGTTWAAAVCMVPWQLHRQYGDTRIIEENMEAMRAWLDGMDRYDFSPEYTYLSGRTGGLSDWLAVDNRTPAALVNNAIYIHMMEVTATMADAIGETEYATVLRERRARARAEWNDLYVDPATGMTRDEDGEIVHTQTSYATPLNFDVFSDENVERAHAYLAELAARPAASGAGAGEFPEHTITTGFSGTPNILPALSRAGFHEAAYGMFTETDYASWLYPVTKGATSVWERWNGYEAAFQENNENRMNSFNHFALGAVGQWMYEFQLGITSGHLDGEAGYKHFVLQPVAGPGYTSLEGSYTSNYGTITSRWEADGRGRMTAYTATVPANTTATLYLPVLSTVVDFAEAEGVTFVRQTIHHGLAVAEYELASGRFEFGISSTGVAASPVR